MTSNLCWLISVFQLMGSMLLEDLLEVLDVQLHKSSRKNNIPWNLKSIVLELFCSLLWLGNTLIQLLGLLTQITGFFSKRNTNNFGRTSKRNRLLCFPTPSKIYLWTWCIMTQTKDLVWTTFLNLNGSRATLLLRINIWCIWSRRKRGRCFLNYDFYAFWIIKYYLLKLMIF